MKLKDWLKQLGRDKSTESELSDASVLDLIRYLENAELDCEQVFSALDRYAETEIRKEDAARLMPLVHSHLELCPECCDEYEALLDVLAKASNAPEN
jgi:uncharacterized protein YdiU (UPF0061 family)